MTYNMKAKREKNEIYKNNKKYNSKDFFIY